ncbi:hypothetical protein NL676_006653 [Syzygium grande]|nr:hypothetical protein NL676_006653 [Syzygium grande]
MLGWVLGVAPLSKLHYDASWIPLLFMFMVAGAHFISFIMLVRRFMQSFIMLVRRFMQRYAKVKVMKDQLKLIKPTIQLVERENRPQEPCHIYLAGLFIVMFIGAIT